MHRCDLLGRLEHDHRAPGDDVRVLEDGLGDGERIDRLLAARQGACVDLAREENLVDEPGEPLRFRGDHVEKLRHRLGRQIFAPQRLRRPVDCRHRRPQLVGDGRDQLDAKLLQFPLVGDVAKPVDGPAGEPDAVHGEPELVIVRVERERLGPARARPVANGDVECDPLPARNSLADRPADDLRVGEARDSRRGAIPEADEAVVVDHRDAVVDVLQRDRRVRTGLCLRARIPFGGQEPRLRNRRSGLCGDAGRDLLVFCREDADLRVSEEEPADDGAVRDEHRNREVASNGEVPRRHPVVRRIAAEARVDGHIVEPDDRRALEGGAEDVCRARHRKARELRPRDA